MFRARREYIGLRGCCLGGEGWIVFRNVKAVIETWDGPQTAKLDGFTTREAVRALVFAAVRGLLPPDGYESGRTGGGLRVGGRTANIRTAMARAGDGRCLFEVKTKPPGVSPTAKA